jgi:hypothetical protein
MAVLPDLPEIEVALTAISPPNDATMADTLKAIEGRQSRS